MKGSPRVPVPERIVSLLASGTELVCALGQGDKLVGRSHECDHPSWVKSLPAVSRPTFDITGSSEAIDRAVRERLARGEPLYRVDEELLLKLAPDVLITQTHCEVCAVSPADLAHGIAPRMVRNQVVALEAGTIDGILRGFRDVAVVLGCPDRGEALVSGILERMQSIAERTKSLAKPTVLCLEWIEPPFAMSNWGPELVTAAGGVSLLAHAGAHSTRTTWDAVIESDPDVLVVAPCGFTLERAMEEAPVLASRPGWSTLRAVREGRAYWADGNLYFNRSGPSVFETVDLLAEMIHPSLFAPHHQGSAWRKWQPDTR